MKNPELSIAARNRRVLLAAWRAPRVLYARDGAVNQRSADDRYRRPAAGPPGECCSKAASRTAPAGLGSFAVGKPTSRSRFHQGPASKDRHPAEDRSPGPVRNHRAGSNRDRRVAVGLGQERRALSLPEPYPGATEPLHETVRPHRSSMDGPHRSGYYVGSTKKRSLAVSFKNSEQRSV
jgi:hypothetical protein